MHIYKQIDFMNNRNLVYALNVAAVIAFIIFLWLFGAIAGSVTFNFDKTYFIWLIVALLVVFTVHEVIHGFLYKLFDHHAKIKIGFKNGIVYVNSPKSLYTKRQFAWIAATPFVALSLILIAMYLINWLPGDLFLGIAALQGAGSVADFMCCIASLPRRSTITLAILKMVLIFILKTEYSGQK